MSNEEAFVNELIGYIFAYPDDDYMTMECLCRKLYKHGLIEKKDGEWTCDFIGVADTLQTERGGRGMNEDLISRQAAIEVADAVWSVTGDVNVAKVWDQIKDLPSATCDDCIWHACNYNKVDWNGENDCISREAAIAVADSSDYVGLSVECAKKVTDEVVKGLKQLPSAQPTLYGYKIEHLAYIARVMEKEGVTADYAVRTFDDISRALRMIIDEVQERVMEALNERYDLQTGGD